MVNVYSMLSFNLFSHRHISDKVTNILGVIIAKLLKTVDIHPVKTVISVHFFSLFTLKAL